MFQRPARRLRRASVVVRAMFAAAVLLVAVGSPARAEVSPATSAAPTTTLNPNAGSTDNTTAGTVVLVVVSVIIVVGAVLIYWRARANRLSGSG